MRFCVNYINGHCPTKNCNFNHGSFTSLLESQRESFMSGKNKPRTRCYYDGYCKLTNTKYLMRDLVGNLGNAAVNTYRHSICLMDDCPFSHPFAIKLFTMYPTSYGGPVPRQEIFEYTRVVEQYIDSYGKDAYHKLDNCYFNKVGVTTSAGVADVANVADTPTPTRKRKLGNLEVDVENFMNSLPTTAKTPATPADLDTPNLYSGTPDPQNYNSEFSLYKFF